MSALVLGFVNTEQRVVQQKEAKELFSIILKNHADWKDSISCKIRTWSSDLLIEEEDFLGRLAERINGLSLLLSDPIDGAPLSDPVLFDEEVWERRTLGECISLSSALHKNLPPPFDQLQSLEALKVHTFVLEMLGFSKKFAPQTSFLALAGPSGKEEDFQLSISGVRSPDLRWLVLFMKICSMQNRRKAALSLYKADSRLKDALQWREEGLKQASDVVTRGEQSAKEAELKLAFTHSQTEQTMRDHLSDLQNKIEQEKEKTRLYQEQEKTTSDEIASLQKKL